MGKFGRKVRTEKTVRTEYAVFSKLLENAHISSIREIFTFKINMVVLLGTCIQNGCDAR